MKRGLLLIDRGSREDDVRKELDNICSQIKAKTDYDYVDYCFLEVLGPFIPKVMADALAKGLDELTVVPYFLYPGKKLKSAVNNAIAKQKDTKTKILISRPMRMHPTLVELVSNRIRTSLDNAGLDTQDKDVDVLVIGHGSVDPNAKRSLDYIDEKIKPRYRNSRYCFLEIEQPDIPRAIKDCESDTPEILVIVFYFLHKGAHVKRDIYEELNPALEASSIKKSLITEHLGTDPKMVDLIIERAAEAESYAD